MTSSLRVEIVLDFVCVHSYIGFTRFIRAARRHRAGGGEVETTFGAYQLRPDASPAGEPLFDVWARDRGEAAAREIAADTSIGADDGLELDFGAAVFTNTFDAHRVLARAAAVGRGEQMARRLFRAYFTDGVNIADHATLARLATEVGVVVGAGGAAEVRADLDRVRRLELPAPPVFRFDDGRVVTGEPSEDELLAVLETS